MKATIIKNTKVSTIGLLVLGLVLTSCGGGDDGGGSQFERMGFPAVNTALIASSRKDSYNQGDPGSDLSNFREEIVANINGVRAAFDAVPGFPAQDTFGITPEGLASVVNPDVITIDLSKPVVFPNGRRLQDDVIDPTLGLVLNRGNVLGGGPGVSDGVSNDSTFIDTFPYLGVPNI